MSTLAIAVQRRHWELVSLCLLLGVTEAAAALPPDAVEGLIEVLAPTDQPVGLAGLDDGHGRARGDGRGRRRR